MTNIFQNLDGNLNRKQIRKISRYLKKKSFRKSTNEYRQFVETLEEMFSSWERYPVKTSTLDYPLVTSCPHTKFREAFFSESTIFESSVFRLLFTSKDDGIYLFKLEIPQNLQGLGLGTTVMSMILDISNGLNIPVYLVPLPFGSVVTSTEYISNLERLKGWYSRLGFEQTRDSKHWKYTPVEEVNETLQGLSLAA